MKIFMTRCAGLLPLAALSPVAALAASQGENAPTNILFIIADDLRPALGCYGYPQVLSPNIDALASRGTVFHQAYCNAPVSGASRASLMTGIFPAMPERFSRFDAWAGVDAPEAVSIPGWLKTHGYTTLSIGKSFHNLRDHDGDWSRYPWRLNPEGYGKDWADYNKWELWLNDDSADHLNLKTNRGPFCEAADRPDEDYDDGQVALKAVETLRDLGESGEPFFLTVGFWRPHLPFNSPQKYWDLYNRDEIEIADNRYRPVGMPKNCTGSGEIKGYGLVDDTSDPEFHRLVRHAYYACVSFIDAQIGKIMDELERSGLADNTLVVFIGDHGWHLGEHNYFGKHNLLHNATCAPLIIVAPDGKGQHSDAVAQFVDLFPTFCDYAGVERPEGIDGISLRPIVVGKRHSVQKYAFVQWDTGIAVSDSRYTYAAWYDENGVQTADMLFDHSSDPQENVNVSAYASNAKVVKRMRGILAKFRIDIREKH